MAKKVQAKSGKASISKKNGDGSVENTEESVGEVQMFEDPPCNVGYSAGIVLPMPDNQYSNVKYQVSLNIPCSHDEIDEAYDYAEEWVDTRVNKLVEEFEEE